MNERIKKLLEGSKLSEAIDLVSELSAKGDKIESLKAIEVRVLKLPKGDSRDIILAKLLNSFGNLDLTEEARSLLEYFNSTSAVSAINKMLSTAQARREAALRLAEANPLGA